MGVKYIENADGEIVYSIYTRDTYFEVINDWIVKEEPHAL